MAGKRTAAPKPVDMENGAHPRLRIIEAAAQAFMREGFASTSIDDVARLLGCTKGLIYYHFKNKTELFFSIHRYTIETNLDNIRPIARGEGAPGEKMGRMVREHIDSIVKKLPYQRVSLVGLEMQAMGRTTLEERAALDELIRMYDDYENLFVRVIADGIKSGEFTDGDPRLIVKPLLGAMNWMIMWYRARPNAGRATLERLREGMADYIMRGLMA